ncbi:hypothetical protein [Mucilaginibacter sp. OK283]|uniref:hypothetical protein n=1 Tax=Mucilaginibacter sp. OK283 TaxID=1881049 RepID=UPI0008B275FF|nr:hypothetical protein [Mucilaginibacter sp. OK283]SEP30053.1 hypothetical protein SAMN05428947_11094 [Mucilaginibacter sp. OK283]
MKNKTILSIIVLFLLLPGFHVLAAKSIGRILGITKTDTSRKPKLNPRLEDDPTPTLKSILHDELKHHHEITKVDTLFVLKQGDTLKVKLRHYCTYDGKINLPPRYLRMYGLKKFKTHNFITALLVKRNSKLIFKGFIKKDDFLHLLDDSLKKYGVLLFPNVEFDQDNLNIQYSISIPLTDVGRGFTLTISKLGEKTVRVD